MSGGTFYFLSNKFKLAGKIVFPAGAIILFLRFGLELKPAFLDIKTFALYSTYLETRYFTVIQNHFTEELGGLLAVIGLAFLIFSKEKDEKPEFAALRLKAFFFSQLLYFIYLALVILFVFGIAFIKAVLFALLFQAVVYLIILNIFLLRFRKSIPRN